MPIANRYEFLFYFDCELGNPNGDPDQDNRPRIDPGTGHGWVTDAAIKRRIRNYIQLVRGDESPNRIYIQHGTNLNTEIARAREATSSGESTEKNGKSGKKGLKLTRDVRAARDWMCQTFYDVRTFGGVLSTGPNAGQVRGPVQITFAKSLDPVDVVELAVTRGAVSKDIPNGTSADYEKWTSEQDEDTLRTIGRKTLIPYGLYCARGFVSGFLGRQTGFSREDLILLMESLLGMYEHDRSSSKGLMSARKLLLFKHLPPELGGEEEKRRAALLGRAPAHVTLNEVCAVVKDQDAMAADGLSDPRSFNHYKVFVDPARIPTGVEMIDVGEDPDWRNKV